MTRTTIRRSGLLQMGAAGAAITAAVNGAVFGIGRAADVSFNYVDAGNESTIVLGDVLFMSVATFAVGLAAAALAVRVGRPGLRAVAALGAAVALLSNVTFPAMEASLATRNLLASMHVVVGIAFVVTLEVVRARQAGDRSPAVPASEPAVAAS